MPTKSTHMAGTNADDPDLSIWVTIFKSLASSNFTFIDLKVASFKIDRHNLTTIVLFINLSWRSLPEVIESEIHRSHYHEQILLYHSEAHELA